ncbi:hypothetical protein [Streptococcus bovimastitidis]|uniref:hypothetical protein n=1 Tax=Streptococcus bovimastitidis TaxID=1856638 RepID=UPI000AE06E15|nr:hypothetical protein [Streptococcus bovimastitidis]
MAYKTTQAIYDGQDEKHYYESGAPFPREGYKPTKKRINDLVKAGYLVEED